MKTLEYPKIPRISKVKIGKFPGAGEPQRLVEVQDEELG